MPAPIPRRIGPAPRGLLRVALALITALAVGAVPARGQAPVTFQTMWDSVRTEDYTAVQIRRFFDYTRAIPSVTSVREEVAVVSNGTEAPDFDLAYLGVEGEPQGSSLWTDWAQKYAQNGDMFVEYGSFKIRDLLRVQGNYSLHDFGPAVRAGRAVRRVVVFPAQLDKAIWLLDVDVLTKVPLYTAEFDAQLRLLSEIVTVSFTHGASLQQSRTAGSQLETPFGSYAAAKAYMGDPAGLVDSGTTAGEYGATSVKVRTDALNNRQTLVVEYTDGVDSFFVLQTPGTPDLFASLPIRQRKARSHTIARYRDQSMSVLLFWDDRVSFQVTGRGALLRLDDFAQNIYRHALLTN